MANGSQDWRARALYFVQHDLWDAEAMAGRGWRGLQGLLQFAVAVVEGVRADNLPLRASALTYYTMLSIVPLLAFVIAITEALGINQNVVTPALDYLTQVAPQIKTWIETTLSGINFGSMGTIGAVTLFATTLLGISSIERTLNGIWGVTRQRPWDRRIPDYLAVLVVAPVFIGFALALGATLQSQTLLLQLRQTAAIELIYTTGLRFAPVLFLWAGFSFLYWFLPNTRVSMSSSLLGGAVAAVLFTAAQSLYVQFNIGAGRANAVYGALSFLPLFLGFVYVAWLIVLLGAEVGAVWENLVHLRRARRGEEPGPAAREALGLAIATRIAIRFDRGDDPVTAEGLADELQLPSRSMRSILDDLESAGVLTLAVDGESGTGYQLGRAADRIRVAEVLGALRGGRDAGRPLAEVSPTVAALVAELDERVDELLDRRRLSDLARRVAGGPAQS